MLLDAGFRPHRSENRSALHDAKAFVRAYLTKNGPCPSQELIDAAVIAGHNPRTIQRARKELRVMTRQTRDGWFVKLRDGS